MPLEEGVVKIEPKDIPVSTPVTNVDDATIKAMAAKSGDSEEHIRKMLGLHEEHKVVETKPVVDSTKAAEEKLLAGKYKTQDELDKGFQSLVDKYGKETAYKMLEKGLGKATDALDGTDKGTADALDVKQDGEAKADTQDADAKPIDMGEFFDEFGEKGELSIESYKKLQDAGFDKALVDSYIEGQVAKGQLYTNSVHNLAGGEQQFNAMVAWGTVNLSEAQKNAFNDAVNSGDINKATTVMDALKSRYEQAEGSFSRSSIEPSNNLTHSDGQVYTRQQMEIDMKDPRYRSGDKNFHAEVQRKMKFLK